MVQCAEGASRLFRVRDVKGTPIGAELKKYDKFYHGGHYILDKDHHIQRVTLDEWAKFFASGKHVIKQETVNGVLVSTVFLGIYYNASRKDAPPTPLMFETMLLSEQQKGLDQFCERYATYDEALKQHKLIVAALRIYAAMNSRTLKERARQSLAALKALVNAEFS